MTAAAPTASLAVGWRRARWARQVALFAALFVALSGCGDAALELGLPQLADIELGESDSGGRATSYDWSARAFYQPVPGLSGAERTRYLAGQVMFEVDWTATTASPTDRDGLGPVFNATSCQACHLHNGRGAPPTQSGEALKTALLRVSVPGRAANAGPAPHPIYGDQIQPLAVSGVHGEGTVRMNFEEVPGTYGDGTPYSLLRPHVVFEPALGDPGPGFLQSVRTAQALIGLGLLAEIPTQDLLTRLDPSDEDHDGISGRPNGMLNPQSGRPELGRFGWKANQPSIMQQNTAAFLGDVGITSSLAPTQNCTAAQPSCLAARDGGSPEIDAPRMDALLTFVRATAVPARRDLRDPEVRRGKHLFQLLTCAACHVPSWQTGEVPDFPALSLQRIWPYTDLLLHDLGAELADGRPDFEADGQEWRTPPLWGIGLQEKVSGHLRLLHDGRARGFAEAILWHGGEAAKARERFRNLPAPDRAALLRFLESL